MEFDEFTLDRGSYRSLFINASIVFYFFLLSQVGRATVQDLKSVEVCMKIIDAIYGKLLEFDFRYSGLKSLFIIPTDFSN